MIAQETRTPHACTKTTHSTSARHDQRAYVKKMAQESLRLVSPQISEQDGRLPRQYSAIGQGAKKDVSPPLEWYGVPDGTKSLALVVQDIDAPDPDSPVMTWTHWVVANIPPDTKGLPEGFYGGGGREQGGLRAGGR
jgi:phosphatidylethanolamine-binding protein (PEBP) family uncharacterized protein